MHYYQFGHRKDIYLWYSSQLDSELHIPIALFRIFVVNINMLHIDRCVVTYRYVTDMLHIDMLPICYSMSLQQQVRFWYLSRYTESDAYLLVLTMK